MSGPHPDTREPATRPISVAELLARNGTIGAPSAAGRRRRRRGNSDAVTVAELTGEIPVIRDDTPPVSDEQVAAAAPEEVAAPETEQQPETEQPAGEPEPASTARWAEPGPRWPKSMPQSLPASGPEHSNYPRPARRSDAAGAEQMSPDPVDSYAGAEVDFGDVVDTEVRDAEPLSDDIAETQPDDGLRQKISRWRRFRARKADKADKADLADQADQADRAGETVGPVPETNLDAAGVADLEADPSTDLDDDHTDIEADLVGEPEQPRSLWSELLGGGLIVLQSMLAVLLGAGLFIAFDQLWHWNNVVALVLTVLVTLGLVAAVQAVRRTVDIGSTLIAVAVGLLVTLGPLALHTN